MAEKAEFGFCTKKKGDFCPPFLIRKSEGTKASLNQIIRHSLIGYAVFSFSLCLCFKCFWNITSCFNRRGIDDANTVIINLYLFIYSYKFIISNCHNNSFKRRRDASHKEASLTVSSLHRIGRGLHMKEIVEKWQKRYNAF